MQLQETLPWTEPLAVARGVPDDSESWVFLYSAMQANYSGRHSILALYPKQTIESEDFHAFSELLTHKESAYGNAWFGYLGYPLRHALEILPHDPPSTFPMPGLWMVNYSLILIFDHEKEHIEVWAENREDMTKIPHPVWRPIASEIQVTNLHSNMTKEEYIHKVQMIKEAILRGDLSQANLTRKFYGSFARPIHPFRFFANLVHYSPSPYSALLKYKNNYIISSSPECFLQIDRDGMVSSRPIKGSAPRFDSADADHGARKQLETSEKDKAENLMIVDLMRNDLSRSCIPGTVGVSQLFDVTSYATIHHMSSTIIGKKQKNTSTLELVEHCFPPGSMTGTPKIKAMELCTELEQAERGVYSGAIGWFGGDGSADLSVVIRTLLTDGKQFEFQVGGAIVADSEPEAEWQETLTKAKAIATTLGLEPTKLEAL